VAKKKQPTVEQPIVPVAAPSATAQRIEEIGKSFEGKGNLILYIIGGIVLAAIVAGLLYSWQSRAAAEAQTALGKAIEITTAQVSPSPIPGSTEPTYASEKERAEKAIAAFEEVANKYGSPYKEKAQYFIAVNRLKVDREAGLRELEGLTKTNNSEVNALSKFALAEARAADGKNDEAVALYNELAKQSNNLIPATTVNFNLASIYEKQGKKAEAADLYFNIVKAAREAKTSDGKAVPIGTTAREAAQKLEKLDAEKFKQLPPEPAATDF
jgi:tetratricopeptide (TPR) repeat protein